MTCHPDTEFKINVGVTCYAYPLETEGRRVD